VTQVDRPERDCRRSFARRTSSVPARAAAS
jgi:hypothetical protein